MHGFHLIVTFKEPFLFLVIF
uniref:Uncharacterized protein n=1 Tax=Rhizophora mucronata TaxID=61149 RepID=A0A2P2N5U7_RHIMU